MTNARSLMIAALVACAAPACDDNDDDVFTDPVQDAVDEGSATGSVMADTAFAELSGADYTVVLGKTASIIAAINDGEINQADFAFQTVIAGDIAGYASLVFDDHDAANANLDAVVDVVGVGFIPSDTESDVAAMFADGLADLTKSPPSDIDFDYMNIEVKNHSSNLVLLQQLRDMLADDEMGAFVDDMRSLEADHLARAEDLFATFF